jgi:haloalkane dehalogenase
VLLKPKPFIEDVLSAWMLRTLDDEELEEYRRPVATPGEDRLPILMWLRQAICGEPAEPVEVVARKFRRSGRVLPRLNRESPT